MATTKTVKTKAVISAQDKASPTIKDIQRRFKAFSRSIKGLSGNLQKLAGVSLAPLAGGLATAAGILKSSVSSMVNYGAAVDDTSRSLGIASEALQSFRYAAELGGSSTEELDGAVAMLNKNMGNVAAGKNKDLAGLMEHLGISMKDANGQMKTAAELMPEIADAIKNQTNATQRAYIATQFFGKSGQNLIKTLSEGSEGLEAARKEAEKFGLILSEQDVKAAAEFGDSMTRTQMAVQGVQNTIGSKLLPVLQPMLDSMNDWIAENREWIATAITEALMDFSNALKTIDFKTLVTGAVSFVKQCAALFSAMGGLKTVAIAVGAIFAGKLVIGFVSTVSALSSVVTTGITLAKVVFPLMTSAVSAFGKALFMNPIGLVIGAIAGLIYVGYQLYKNWDTVSRFFIDSWESIKQAFSGAGEWMSALWDGVINASSECWDNFCSYITETIPDSIRSAWESVKAWFQSVFDAMLSPIDTVEASLDSVGEWFDNLFSEVLLSVGDISASWDDFCNLITETIPNKIKSVWEGIKNWFKGIFDAILSPIETISKGWDIVKGTVSEKVGGAWESFKKSVGLGEDEPEPTRVSSAFPTSEEAISYAPAAPAPAAMSLSPMPLTSEVNSSMVVTVRTPEGVEATVDNYRSDAPNSTFKAHTETNRGLLR